MQKDTQLIGNLVSLAKNKIIEAALNNPEKIGEFVAELALKNDATRTFLKSMDWSAESFGKTVESLVSGGIRAYQNREGFRSTDAERKNSQMSLRKFPAVDVSRRSRPVFSLPATQSSMAGKFRKFSSSKAR